uniref:Uncharacterized protein n=1 Tax=Rhizophora mucronata TaxID=61149 RepID=A0A2P2LE78_RHIMU
MLSINKYKFLCDTTEDHLIQSILISGPIGEANKMLCNHWLS